MVQVKVIFEDNYILVIDKPASLVVNRSETVKGFTLQDWIERRAGYNYKKGKSGKDFEYFIKRSGVVHRLDKDTSGVMVIAKSLKAFEKLLSQFALRNVEKSYLALLHGVFEPRVGSLSLPLARSRGDRERFDVNAKGKVAKTSWDVLEIYKRLNCEGVSTKGYQGFSYVRVMPKTGRTHQIRVHMNHLKHPVVGDARYTGRRRAREDKKWCKRQFLHAFSLSFDHPEGGKRVGFKASLASDLSKVLSLLE